jgi:hypothetical protein
VLVVFIDMGGVGFWFSAGEDPPRDKGETFAVGGGMDGAEAAFGRSGVLGAAGGGGGRGVDGGGGGTTTGFFSDTAGAGVVVGGMIT